MADGQVSMGNTVVKSKAKKLRRIGTDVLCGFAGSTADALTLFERLETKLGEHPGQLARACVELAKDWRMDKFLRRLEALMIVADAKTTLMMSGTGDVLEPDDGCIGIGSGGLYAYSAAKALMAVDGLTADEIAERAMKIAGDICVFTNSSFVKDSLDV
eukprot:TRINITY_DN3426_c0_g1_i1.p2 TRINITY_DN3426_c0_g1~~TRINITY_DN3426_c0_g1_i1.p2  ORF type:complete len:159 (-),score=36.44 TRINITY_DN3426_c0_g1_i1:25-501(-)